MCQISVQNKIKFKKPAIKEDGRGFADDADDEFGGNDFEGNADIADMYDKMNQGVESEEDIDEDMDFGVGAVIKNDDQEML